MYKIGECTQVRTAGTLKQHHVARVEGAGFPASPQKARHSPPPGPSLQTCQNSESNILQQYKLSNAKHTQTGGTHIYIL